MNAKADSDWASHLREGELVKIAANTGLRVDWETLEELETGVDWETVDPKTETRLMEVGVLMRNAGPEISIDSLGHKLLPTAIDGDCLYAYWPRYWSNLKDEFRLFICTSDKKYATLRKKLSKSATKSQTAIVSAIAAAMAAKFGVITGVLVPFVAMCLVVLARVGKEAFCTTFEWNMPLNPNAKVVPKNG